VSTTASDDVVVRSPSPLVQRIGVGVCVVNGLVAAGLVTWLVVTLPSGLSGQAFLDDPWLARWLKIALLLATLLPGSTLMLWRACPVQALPRAQWPRGDATPPSRRVRRGAPPHARLALSLLAVHCACLVALPLLAFVASGEAG
jgi:hypothetical protein